MQVLVKLKDGREKRLDVKWPEKFEEELQSVYNSQWEKEISRILCGRIIEELLWCNITFKKIESINFEED